MVSFFKISVKGICKILKKSFVSILQSSYIFKKIKQKLDTAKLSVENHDFQAFLSEFQPKFGLKYPNMSKLPENTNHAREINVFCVTYVFYCDFVSSRPTRIHNRVHVYKTEDVHVNYSRKPRFLRYFFEKRPFAPKYRFDQTSRICTKFWCKCARLSVRISSADESDKVIWCKRCHLKKCQSYITFLSQVIFFVTFWQKKLNSIILLPKIQILTCSTLYLFSLSNFCLKRWLFQGKIDFFQ